MLLKETQSFGADALAGLEEDPDWPEVRRWLRSNCYQPLSSVQNPSLLDLLSALFASKAKEVKAVVETFARNVIFSFHLMKKLYSPQLIEFLKENELGVWELLGDSKLSRVDISLFVISALTKMNISLISIQDGEPQIEFFGSDRLPSKVFIIKFKSKFIVAKKVPIFSEATSLSSSSFSKGILSEQKMAQGTFELLEKSADLIPKVLRNNLDFLEKTSLIESTSSDSWKDSDSSEFSTYVATDKLQFSDPNIDVSRTKSKSSAPNAVNPQKGTHFASLKEIKSSQVSPKENATSKKDHYKGTSEKSLAGLSSQGSSQSLIREKFRPNILVEETEYRWGKMKFYSHKKGFGFILSQRKEFFVQKDDFLKSGINIEDPEVRTSLTRTQVKFRLIKYKGNHNEALKAFDIKLV